MSKKLSLLWHNELSELSTGLSQTVICNGLKHSKNFFLILIFLSKKTFLLCLDSLRVTVYFSYNNLLKHNELTSITTLNDTTYLK